MSFDHERAVRFSNPLSRRTGHGDLAVLSLDFGLALADLPRLATEPKYPYWSFVPQEGDEHVDGDEMDPVTNFTDAIFVRLGDFRRLCEDFAPKMIAADGDGSRIAEFRPATYGERTYHHIDETAHLAASEFLHELSENLVKGEKLALGSIGGEDRDEVVRDFYRDRVDLIRERLAKHEFDANELSRVHARMRRETVLLFDYIGETLPEFITVEMVSAWTGLEIKSLAPYRREWPGLARTGRKGKPALYRKNEALPKIREQFPDVIIPE